MKKHAIDVCVYIITLIFWGKAEEFTNSFVVEVDGGREVVRSLAEHHGFMVEEEIAELNVYHLIHPEVKSRSKRSADHHVYALHQDPRVKYAAQQKHLVRHKRRRHIVYDKQRDFEYEEVANKSLYQRFLPVEDDRLQAKDQFGVVQMEMNFNDPFYKDEWYIKNKGQSGGLPGMDLNLQVAWTMGYTGKGVVACILDDGIDHTHPDLIDNYDPKASADFNDQMDNDPMPRDDPDNSHGTKCAGEIAAKANNDNCGVGIAYDCKIGGIRMLDGGVTDLLEAKALSFMSDYIDVFSASWGPRDDGRTMEGPYPLAVKAFINGVLKGRKGLGSIYVWATGNGGLAQDDCNADGYVSRPETLSIGSVNDRGSRPYFMEVCASTLAVVPTGGYETPQEMSMEHKPKIKVVTTDLHKGCTLGFQGTSSAAPMAAGCIALALQANKQLSWRDVQHIVVYSARITINDGSWVQNGGGFHVSSNFGFGVLDCSRMVMLAQTWINVPIRHICEGGMKTEDRDFNSGEIITISIKSDGCLSDHDANINTLEHVQVYIKLEHSYRGDVQIFLKSPQGTRSEMLSPRPADNSTDGIDFTFTSVQMWGENPNGTWILTVNDKAGDDDNKNTGKLLKFQLILHGFFDDKKVEVRSVAQQKSYIPDKSEVDLIMEKEKEQSLTVEIKKSDILAENENELKSETNSLLHVKTKKITDRVQKKTKKIDEILSPEEFDTLANLLKTLEEQKRPASESKPENLKRTLENLLLEQKSEHQNEPDSSSTLPADFKRLVSNIRSNIATLLRDLKSPYKRNKNSRQPEMGDLKRFLESDQNNKHDSVDLNNLNSENVNPTNHSNNLKKALDKIKKLLKELNSR